jgi:hypothetical protein
MKTLGRFAAVVVLLGTFFYLTARGTEQRSRIAEAVRVCDQSGREAVSKFGALAYTESFEGCLVKTLPNELLPEYLRKQ